MSFKFTPKSEAAFKVEEQERAESLLWEIGQYPFEVTNAFNKVSAEKFDDEGNYKSGGKAMIELRINIFNDEGKFQSLLDFLLPDGPFAFKLRHAAYACGLGANYESGDIDVLDFKGKTGIVKVGIQKAQNGYPARNNILDYILDEAASAQYSAVKTDKAQKETPPFDDEIIF